ncbi:MAG: hypothetical protein MR491_05520 [Mollicutes bacterium]|nr:hypothetical protein [Mollicutes bacterium]
MEGFIEWIIENKDVIIDVFSIVGTAFFAVLNCVLTLIKTRKSRITKIVSDEKELNSLTQKVRERLKKGD